MENYRRLMERKATKELVKAQSQHLKLSSSLRFQDFFKSLIQNTKKTLLSAVISICLSRGG